MTAPIDTSLSHYQALIAGIQTGCPNGTFILRGATYTAAQAIALLSALYETALAERVAKTEWQNARAAVALAEANDGLIARELRQILAVSFSQDATQLATLGITPRKSRAPLSVEDRLSATEKLRATRKARGTMSKKQRLTIRGNVTGVTITPVVEGSAEAASGTDRA